MTVKLDKKTLLLAEKYLEYKNDPIKFAEELILLPTPGGSTNVKLYEPQKEVLRSFFENHHLILLKSRQTGFSTLCRIIITYVATFYDNCIMGVLSKTGAASSDFNRKAEDLIDRLPKWIRPVYEHKSIQSFSLTNGSELNSAAVSPANPGAVFRGLSLSILIIDECAHTSKISEAWTGIAPALSKAQMDAEKHGVPFGTIILSTPNRKEGIGKWFYQRWSDAISRRGIEYDPTIEDADIKKEIKKETDKDIGTDIVSEGHEKSGGVIHHSKGLFVPHKIYWKQIPDFVNDPEWYYKQCEMLENSPSKIAQELELKFISVENSLFNERIQEDLQNPKKKPLESIPLLRRFELYRYSPISKDRFYMIGVDSASEAGGKDYSTIEVFDFITMEQVLEFKGKIAVKKFARIVSLCSRICPRNILIIEKTGGYGNQVIEELTADTEYSYNLYGETKGHGSSAVFIPGLNTTPQSRPLIVDALFNFVNGNPESIRSERLALELVGLTDKTNRIEADTGGNDDLAMALGFICYVRHYKKEVLGNTDPEDIEATVFAEESISFISGLNEDLSPMRAEFHDNDYDGFKRSLHRYIKENVGSLGGSVNVFDLFRNSSGPFKKK